MTSFPIQPNQFLSIKITFQVNFTVVDKTAKYGQNEVYADDFDVCSDRVHRSVCIVSFNISRYELLADF